jgi:hypothetical protein
VQIGGCPCSVFETNDDGDSVPKSDVVRAGIICVPKSSNSVPLQQK